MTGNMDTVAQRDPTLLAARRGDPEAQRLFASRHARAVYNLARVALGPVPEVEEVLQRVMLEALNAPELPARRTEPWLAKLAIRQLQGLSAEGGASQGRSWRLDMQPLVLLLVDGLRLSLAEAAWVLDEPDAARELHAARLRALAATRIGNPSAAVRPEGLPGPGR